MLNSPIDVSTEFYKLENTYFMAETVNDFDVQTGKGTISFQRMSRKERISFNISNLFYFCSLIVSK